MDSQFKTADQNIFCDAHLHFYNLSHIGIIAFLGRYIKSIVYTIHKISKKRWRIILIVFLLIYLGNLFLFYLFIEAIIIFIKALLDIFFKIKKPQVKLSFFKRILNLLSIIENDIGSQIRYIEFDYLRLNNITDKILENELPPDSNYSEIYEKLQNSGHDMSITFNNLPISKVILTPLIMDFDKTKFPEGLMTSFYYKFQPRKKVLDQTNDLFNGISEYYQTSKFKLLEIFPFVGINPSNYNLGPRIEVTKLQLALIHKFPLEIREKIFIFNSQVFKHDPKVKNYKIGLLQNISDHDIESVQDNELLDLLKTLRTYKTQTNDLMPVFYQYFKHFNINEKPKDRMDRLLQKKNKFLTECINHNDCNLGGWRKTIHPVDFYFIGVKLYPPLSFNPWPEKSESDMQKVCFVYQYCSEKQIPITVHCSDGGFVVLDKKRSRGYTDPDNWAKVLNEFPDLRLNFAHFGIQYNEFRSNCFNEWFEKVVNLIVDKKNVYADISDLGASPKEYEKLFNAIAGHNKFIDENKDKILSRIIFGTDFLVNLFRVNSYKDYLRTFEKADHDILDSKIKRNMYCTNALRFLHIC